MGRRVDRPGSPRLIHRFTAATLCAAAGDDAGEDRCREGAVGAVWAHEFPLAKRT
jgi:hypothetical protein